MRVTAKQRIALMMLALLAPGVGRVAAAQVAATETFAAALSRAEAQEANTANTSLLLHVHYALKLYDHKGKLTTGSWDVWRDPQKYERVDIRAGDFQYTHIDDLKEKKQWRHFNVFMPLKVFDLRENYELPVYAAQKLLQLKPPPMVQFAQVDGMPFDCTPADLQVRICFDPLAHMLAFAQVWNQSMTWENWQPVGLQSVPRRFRIYDAGQVMVEAAGEAAVVKTFPPGLFAIPPNEPDMGEPELDGSIPHKVISMKPVRMDPYYGNVLLLATVGLDGKVKKLKVLDADNDDIIGDTKRFAKHLTFAPQIRNGVPVEFQTYLYLKHGPLG